MTADKIHVIILDNTKLFKLQFNLPHLKVRVMVRLNYHLHIQVQLPILQCKFQLNVVAIVILVVDPLV